MTDQRFNDLMRQAFASPDPRTVCENLSDEEVLELDYRFNEMCLLIKASGVRNSQGETLEDTIRRTKLAE